MSIFESFVCDVMMTGLERSGWVQVSFVSFGIGRRGVVDLAGGATTCKELPKYGIKKMSAFNLGGKK